MADILPFPGVAQVEPLPEGENFPTYLRRLADMIDAGEVPARALVVTVVGENSIHVQYMGTDPLQTIGLLYLAQRALGSS